MLQKWQKEKKFEVLYPNWPSLNEGTKGKKMGGGRRAVIVCMPVSSRPFLINIASSIRPHLVFAASRRLKLIVSAVSIRGNTVYLYTYIVHTYNYYIL